MYGKKAIMNIFFQLMDVWCLAFKPIITKVFFEFPPCLLANPVLVFATLANRSIGFSKIFSAVFFRINGMSVN